MLVLKSSYEMSPVCRLSLGKSFLSKPGLNVMTSSLTLLAICNRISQIPNNLPDSIFFFKHVFKSIKICAHFDSVLMQKIVRNNLLLSHNTILKRHMNNE